MATDRTAELFDHDAEATVIGAVLADPERVLALPEVQALRFTDFMLASHRRIWQAIQGLERAGRGVDLVTLRDELRSAKGGDQDYTEASKILERLPEVWHAADAAAIVKGYARRRQAEQIMSKLGAAIQGKGDFDDGVDQAVEQLTDLKMERGGPVEFCTSEQIREYYGEVQWAWPGWIPVGHLTMIAGAQGEGKSWLAARLAASFSLQAEEWPDGQQYSDHQGWAKERLPGHVLMVETEQLRGAYVERWERAGVQPHWMIWGPGKEETHLPDLLNDADAIERLAREREAGAIIVDSLSGGHGLKETGAEMRRLLRRYSQMASRLDIPILLVHHVRKRHELESTQVTLDRVRGSTTITQFCRSVIALYRLEDGDQVAPVRLESIKSTFCKPPEALGFTITDAGLVFGEAPQPIRPMTLQDQAAELLLTMLASGPVPSSELYEEAEAAGISKRTLKIAKKTLGIVAKRHGGAGGHWTWGLPAHLEDDEILL